MTNFLTRTVLVSKTMWSLNISQICLVILVTNVKWLLQPKQLLTYTEQESINQQIKGFTNNFVSKLCIFINPIFILLYLAGYIFQEPSELLQFVKKDPSDLKHHCTLCGTFSHKSSYCTRNHVESQHFPQMFSYPCDKCEQIFTTKTTLDHHKTRKHKSQKKQDHFII